jgi:hypothetical protein
MSLLYALMVGLAPGSTFTQSLILTLIIVSTLTTHAIIVPLPQTYSRPSDQPM